MVFVAIAGVTSFGGREYWAWLMSQGRPSPVYGSKVSATAGRKSEQIWVAGRPIPVSITYDFRFRDPKPASGTTCLLWAEVWFEDGGTGLAVERYTFDAPLTVGGRERASGALTWDALLPRPGRYQLNHKLYYEAGAGELRSMGGGGRSYNIVAVARSSEPPGDRGARP